MRIWGRRNQSIVCGLILIICLVLLYILTIQMEKLAPVSLESKSASPKESPITVKNQTEIIDIEQLYTYHNQELNSENLEKVASLMMGKTYFMKAKLKNEQKPCTVELEYYGTSTEVNLSEGKSQQLVLVNAVTLMSLFEEIDTVDICVMRGSKVYEKVIYKPDLEDYFNISITDINDQETFERLADEFLDSDKVNTYWGMPHAYDSMLGEDAEKYFKCYFAPEDTEGILLPKGQEELEEALKKKYGSQLFVSGLSYKNKNINYYCANQLMSYYGTKDLEEILIELIACKNTSNSQEVKKACNQAKKILTAQQTAQPLLFSKFSEIHQGSSLELLWQGKCHTLASWKGEESGNIEVVSLSENKTYVLCQVTAGKEKYLYTLPVQQSAHYTINEEMALYNGKSVCKELYKVVSKNIVPAQQSMARKEKEEIACTWLKGPFILFKWGQSCIYNSQTQKMGSSDLLTEGFNKETLTAILEEKCKITNLMEEKNELKGYTYSTSEIAGEKVSFYEFKNSKEREAALSTENMPFIGARHIWNKGKLIAAYNGSDQKLTALMGQAMK